ncbi:unnamed protein product [marine sediment metagenome]|uniref:Uncharacterized protein n=1 Tax=marine sediment metagenome TaxID=412755 RepID=X1LIH3_9ZZZZ
MPFVTCWSITLFVPEKEFYSLGEEIDGEVLGEKIGTRFHIQNVSGKTVNRFQKIGQGVEGHGIVEDAEGNKLRFGNIRWGMEWDTDYSQVLRPNEIFTLDGPEIDIRGYNKYGNPGRMGGSIVYCKPGQYFIRFNLTFDTGLILEPGKRELVIKAASRSDKGTDRFAPGGIKLSVDNAGIGIIAEKTVFYKNEVVSFDIKVCNWGDKELLITEGEYGFRLLVDGEEYLWNHKSMNVRPTYIRMGKDKEHIVPVTIDKDEWRSIENGRRFLEIKPGWHAIQAVAKPHPSSEIKQPIYSNIVTIRVLNEVKTANLISKHRPSSQRHQILFLRRQLFSRPSP